MSPFGQRFLFCSRETPAGHPTDFVLICSADGGEGGIIPLRGLCEFGAPHFYDCAPALAVERRSSSHREISTFRCAQNWRRGWDYPASRAFRDWLRFNDALSSQSLGEGGIRTHGTFPFSGFQDRRNRPLCHLSSRTPKKHRECSNTGNIPFFFNRLKPRICFRGDVIKPGQAQSAACHSRTLGANLTWTNCGPRQFPARSRSESCPPPPV